MPDSDHPADAPPPPEADADVVSAPPPSPTAGTARSPFLSRPASRAGAEPFNPSGEGVFISAGLAASALPSPKPAQEPDARVGSWVGTYRVRYVLGRGPAGAVYEAEDSAGRVVALKAVPEAIFGSADGLMRFLRDAEAFARVSHPNLVAIHGVERHEGLCCLVMERTGGGSAQDALDEGGAFDWRQATRWAAGACRALAAAHAAGLLHRDVKPANLLRAAAGQPGSGAAAAGATVGATAGATAGAVKLGAFGLARDAPHGGASLGGSGPAFGTPHYMSPEQCRSERLDARSDLYSLGATYYALLVGQPAYDRGTPHQVMLAHCSDPVPDPRDLNHAVPEGCASIVRRAMAKSPAARYATAQQMLADLEAALPRDERAAARRAGEPANGTFTRRRGRGLWKWILLAAAAGAGAYWGFRPS